MSEPTIHCEGDHELQARLLKTSEVKAARQKLAGNSAVSMRRRLLATSLRLTKSMSPKLNRMH